MLVYHYLELFTYYFKLWTCCAYGFYYITVMKILNLTEGPMTLYWSAGQTQQLIRIQVERARSQIHFFLYYTEHNFNLCLYYTIRSYGKCLRN